LVDGLAKNLMSRAERESLKNFGRIVFGGVVDKNEFLFAGELEGVDFLQKVFKMTGFIVDGNDKAHERHPERA